MISAGSAFAASDAAADVSDADIVAIADVGTSNEENNDLNNELTENNAILKAADDLNETTLIVENDTAYQIPKVLEGEAYYHIALFSNDSAVVGRTIFVDFDGDISNVTTSIYGEAIYKIPAVYEQGKYPIKVDFAGDDVYAPATATAQVELLEVVTEIKPLINITEYPRIAVKENLGYFPFVFTAAVSENETELLANRTIWVQFDDGEAINLTTDEYGIGAFLIPNNTLAGQHFINITYKSGEGYTGSSFATEIEIYNLETQIIAFKNMSYSRPAVIEGNALYPILLTTYNTTIPIPLANATVKVRFNNGDVEEFTTNSIGYINYTIPASAFEGNYSMEIIYEGEDGYEYSELFANIEVYFIETQIIAFKNHSYPRPVVVHGDAWYPILLATNTSITINGTEYNIPIPIANKTISIEFEDYSVELTTNSFGYVNITLPADTPAGNHTMKIVYDGEDGYTFTAFETTVEVYDVPTEIIALGNISYPRPLVSEGYGYYPIMLVSETNITIGNETITIPFPLANKTVSVDFLGIVENFTTDAFGLINLTIPTDVTPGNYTGTFSYDGEADGYIGTDLTVTIEVYDVPTQIFALDNVSYPRPVVIEGYGYYPIALTTDLGFDIYNVTIPIDIPLANRTIYVQFDNRDIVELTTNEFGIANYTIPKDAIAGNHTIWMLYDGEDGYNYVNVTTNVELYDVPTQIFALDNVSYPRPVVVEGYGYYPIGLTTDIPVPIYVNYTLNITENCSIPIFINTTIPVDIPLANKTVYVIFNGEEDVFTTNDLGIINYIIPVDTVAGNYTVEMMFAGADEGYIDSKLVTNVEVYDVPTRITAIDELAYPRALVINDLAFFPLALTTDTYVSINGTEYLIPIPLANKTVLIGLDDGELAEFTTDELGVIIYTLPFEAYTGNHTVVMVYEGDEGYVPSSLNVTVEIFDVDTQIFALDNMSYPAPLVAAGLAYYPIGLTTDIPIPVVVNYTLNITDNWTIPIVINTTIPVDIPIANKTVHIFFNGEEEEFTTNALGIINYIIPVDTVAGNYTVEMIFAGTDGYRDSKLVTNVEVYDIPTVITSLGNLSYPTPVVLEGLGYYPILLTTNISFTINGTVIPIPLPLANKTLTVDFNGVSEELMTNEYGIAYYVIPTTTTAGNYTIDIAFAGEEGIYAPTGLTTDVEIYDLATEFIAPDNITFEAADVTSGFAKIPIFLATNTTVPIPLINKTVLVNFDDKFEVYTTSWLGMISYAVPENTPAGNFTLSIAFLGQDGYAASQDVVLVEIIGINTEIVAEPTITVKVKDLNNTAFNLTLIDENGNVLANQTIAIEFNGIVGDYVTDENGAISYGLSEVPAGNHTIVMNYAGAGNYTASEAVSTVVAVKEQQPTKIFLRNALYFVTQNKIVNVTLWDANNNPIVGKKVSITMYNSTWSGITDETGTAHIRVGIGFGVHDAVVHFDGDDDYSASNRSGYVRVIKETPSVMVRGADARFKVTDPVKTVKVYLWDRTSKPLPVGSKIVLKINGQTYVGFTDSEGIARMNIDINKVGTFNAEVKYGGNTAYNAVTRIVKFVIQ